MVLTILALTVLMVCFSFGSSTFEAEMVVSTLTLKKETQKLNDTTLILKQAGKPELVAWVESLFERYARDAEADNLLSTGAAAELLGVSPNTVKNWMKGGHFPGTVVTVGGHWRFDREDVLAVKARMDLLRDKNLRREIAPPDEGEDGEDPPLL